LPGIIGFLLSLTGEGDLLILMAVFGATISYVLMMLSSTFHQAFYKGVVIQDEINAI
jgi:hypothetical protein